MAILLLEGRAGLPEFTDEVVLRPDVQAMIEQSRLRACDHEAERAGYDKMTTHHRHRAEGRPHLFAAAPTSARAARRTR